MKMANRANLLKTHNKMTTLQDSFAQTQTKQIMECITHANQIGLTGKERKKWVIQDLSFLWSMCQDEVSEIYEVKKLLSKRIPKKDRLIASQNYINRLIENIQFI